MITAIRTNHATFLANGFIIVSLVERLAAEPRDLKLEPTTSIRTGITCQCSRRFAEEHHWVTGNR